YISPLSDLPKLQTLVLDNNQIRNLIPLYGLKASPKLMLSIRYNPVSSEQKRMLRRNVNPLSVLVDNEPCDCGECDICKQLYLLGDVTGTGTVGIDDALEILRFLAKLPNVIDGNESAKDAACIVSEDVPGISDALEVLKKLAKLPNVIDGDVS
ncbi:MAG: hypothetical protein FWF82_02365, partial [Oscillospiraceae bacterium]|nr:hypothetical protein [Oscillospiraceae bacterium]